MAIARDQLLRALASQIMQDAQEAAKRDGDVLNEPYRAAGDKLVDEALALIP